MRAVAKDTGGKEAFAYLAITLLVLSSGYISFLVSMRRSSMDADEGLKEIRIVSSDLDRVEDDVRAVLVNEHDTLFMALLRDPDSIDPTSLDGAVQGELSSTLEGKLRSILLRRNSSLKRTRFFLESVRVDSRPLKAYHSLPSPDQGMGEGHVSGLTTHSLQQVSMGVNTTMEVVIRGVSGGGGHEQLRTVSLDVERDTWLDVLRYDLRRFEMALRGPELRELYRHMISTLAEAKAYLGYGRTTISSSSVPSLLSEGEMTACLDLAVHLLARCYLGAFDPEGLSSVEAVFRDAADSVGASPSIWDMLAAHDGRVDPGMLVLLSEGLFSEECPPSMEQFLRPVLLSIVERLVFGIVDYLGLDNALLDITGGYFRLMNMASSFVDSLYEKVLGRKVIGAKEKGIRDLTRGLFEDACIPGGTVIVERTIPDAEWMGAPVDSYPPVGPWERSSVLELDLMNGSVVERYRITVESRFDAFEPAFVSRDLLSNDRFLETASGKLGTDNGCMGAEAELRQQLEQVIRDSINRLIIELSEAGEEAWDEMFRGWTTDDLPPLNGTMDPGSFMMGLSMSSIPDVVQRLAGIVAGNIDSYGVDLLKDSVMTALGNSISDAIYDDYDSITRKEEVIDSNLESYLSGLPAGMSIEVASIEDMGPGEDMSGVLRGDDGQPLTLEGLLSDGELLTEISITDGETGEIDPLIRERVRGFLSESYDAVREREFGPGMAGYEMGVIRAALVGASTRSAGTAASLISIRDLEGIRGTVSDLLKGVVGGIRNDVELSGNLSASRWMLPPMGNETGIPVFPGDGREVRIPVRVDIDTAPGGSVELEPTGGFHEPDPRSERAPYRTDLDIRVGRTYNISCSAGNGSDLHSLVELDLDIDFSTYTAWPVMGADYEEGDTLWDLVKDSVKDAAVRLAGKLLNSSSDLFGDALPSLKEVPPLITDLLNSGELDTAEISRVATNVTMDISSTLRDNVKALVRELMEQALSMALRELLSIIGSDEFSVDLRFGSLDVTLSTGMEALAGGPGVLLGVELAVGSIGLEGGMNVVRTEESTISLNGSFKIASGPLDMRILLDPFMDEMPHMVSIEGSYMKKEGGRIGFSLSVPSLEEYRVSEVSLSSCLGVEPVIPIPPLGIQAVLDGGFRLVYRMPGELPPHLNELHFGNGSLSWVEIYDPRLHPLSGSRLEARGPDGSLLASWDIRGQPACHMQVPTDPSGLRGGRGYLPEGISVHFLLISPSGLLMDDVIVEGIHDGSIGRDRDGFGIWSWCDPTPSSPNGPPPPMSMKSLILSLALSSVRDAWDEAFSLYGLSFDTLVHFLERSIELFIERFISMVRELIIDVRLFFSLEVEDASGSAGGGLEISLRADGEAVARFLEWLSSNIGVLVQNLRDPKNSADMSGFPLDILEDCWITLMIYSEVETPVSVEKFAPEGTDIPDSLTLGCTGSVNLALPASLLGMDAGNWKVEFGVKVREAPDAIVGIFYDVSSFSATSDLWLIRGAVWEDDG